jgi:type II secretory pathway pseudopilin PulG
MIIRAEIIRAANGAADGFATHRDAASVRSANGRRRARGGFSLLELLVVVFILLTVTAISLPLVVPAMSGRQVREGARMLNTFINAARSRAIETGRPAGVWIERLPGLREAAANIYYAEIPPVYSGDYLDSSVELFAVNGTPTASGVTGCNIFTWERVDTSCKDYWNIVVPRSRTTFNTDIWASPDPLEQQVVREGDLIQIEGSDRRIPLKIVKASISGATSATAGNLWWYIYRGRNCDPAAGPDGPYYNPPLRRPTGEFVIHWFDRNIHVSGAAVRTTTNVPFNSNVIGLKYKIYRQPIKLQAGSIKLPDGVVIDLGFSSITNGNNSDSGLPFHARQDPTNVNNPWWGAPVYPQDETPIILVFSPGGHMERIYFRMTEGFSGTAAANRQWLWGGMEPFGQIHFLVGKIEKVLPDEYYLKAQDATTNYEKQRKKNWVDTENFWVNVNPQTGFVSTAIVNGWGTIIGNNQALIGEAQFDPANNETGAANPARVYQTRLKARYARVMGGVAN